MKHEGGAGEAKESARQKGRGEEAEEVKKEYVSQTVMFSGRP